MTGSIHEASMIYLDENGDEASPPCASTNALTTVRRRSTESEERQKSNLPSASDQRLTPSAKICCVCCLRFPYDSDEFRTHLLDHLDIYAGKTVCPSCLTHCGTYEKLVFHFLYVHGEVQKHVCPDDSCVRAFWTKKTMDRHLKNHKN